MAEESVSLAIPSNESAEPYAVAHTNNGEDDSTTAVPSSTTTPRNPASTPLPVMDVEQEARILRADLEDLFARVRTQSNTLSFLHDAAPEQISLATEHLSEWTEQEFFLLVSRFSESALQRAVILTMSGINHYHHHHHQSNNQNHNHQVAWPASTQQENGNGADNDIDDDKHYNGTDDQRLPIHLACEYFAPVNVIAYLLKADQTRTKTCTNYTSPNTTVAGAAARTALSIHAKDKWGDLPLHIACSRVRREDPEATRAVVHMLLRADPLHETLAVMDSQESMPLHMACRYGAPVQVVHELLASPAGRATLQAEGIHGQYPLHIACRSEASVEVIQALLSADDGQQTVLKQDAGDRLPIHVYLVRGRNPDIIRALLTAMLQGRMERLGRTQWKANLHALVTRMTDVHERDFMTREKLDAIIVAIRALLEREVLLELAVWKSACCAGLRHEARLSSASSLSSSSSSCEPPYGFFASMKEIDTWAEKLSSNDIQTTENILDAARYKKEQRLHSGADIIVHAVIPFLEGEAVEQALAEIVAMHPEMRH